MAFAAAFSPLRIVNRAFYMVGRNASRLLLTKTLFYWLPYVSAVYLLFSPLYDHAVIVRSAYDTQYLWRVSTLFLLLLFLNNLDYCIAGQILYDDWRLIHAPLSQLVREGFAKAFRSAWLAIPVSGVCYYLLYYGGFVPGIPISYIMAFTLPLYMLERWKLKESWHSGISVIKGRNLPLITNCTLICLACLGVERLVVVFRDALGGHVAPLWQVLIPTPFSFLVSLFINAWSMSLYVTAREQVKSPLEKVVSVFE